MRKLIKVTQKHINKGRRAYADSCPIALAVQEQAPKDGFVFHLCHNHGAYYAIDKETGKVLDGMYTKDVKYEYIPSTRVANFINKFDKLGKKAVKPFNFYLELT